MKVVMIGHDFDFSGGDGISRYSAEISKGVAKHAYVRKISTGRFPRAVRAFSKIKVGYADVAHLMYPDAARIDSGDAKVATMWHDIRMFTKYAGATQQRVKPKLVERLDFARGIVQRWAEENYRKSNIIFHNSTQTRREIEQYFSKTGMYDATKLYVLTPLGINKEYLKAKVWRGARKDFGYIGSIHLKHKNLVGLLKAFNDISGKSDQKLHIFTSSPGAHELFADAIRMFPNLSGRNVILHFRASDAEIVRYLRRFVACLHLSKYEGLGIIVQESLAVGTKVIVIKEGTIPDEARKYAINVREREVAEKALDLVRSQEPAPRVAISYARTFTWDSAVKKTLAAYKQILTR